MSTTSRAGFLKLLALGVFSGAAAKSQGWAAGIGTAGGPAWKGRKNSRVKRWDLVTIGNLSRNRYWGEPDNKAVRSAICSCTLIQGEDFRLLVDPSLAEEDAMARELDRRVGLKPTAITAAFITHEHADHWFGLRHFPQARWLAAPAVAAALNQAGKLSKPVEPASGRLFDAIELLPTPGHTLSHHSLRFDCDNLSIVVAGDAVATRDFWRDRRGYYNCVDFALSARSMEAINHAADIVVPGHDSYFLAQVT